MPDVTDAVLVEGANKAFGEAVVLEDLRLRVPTGTIVGLIGPSGAGKTTTVRLLTGALAPDSGEVRVLGEAPTDFRRETRERIGYMPQLFMLYPDLTVRENVDFVASLYGLFFLRRRRRTRDVLRLVDLWDVRRRRASDLSGGMQRRLELACALVHDPSLLFLDEPTAGLDPLLRGLVWDELHRLREAGRTMLVTTQYLNEAEACDRVALIAEGRLVALDTPDALRREAVGGDQVLIETEAPFDWQALKDLPFVRDVRLIDPRSVRLTVDDAATALPDLVQRLGESEVDVTSSREERPSFDEVFATLVERHAGAPTVGSSEGEPAAASAEAAA